MQPIMSREALERLLAEEFSLSNSGGEAFSIASIEASRALLRFDAQERHLRPGGMVSGPILFAFADAAAHAAIFAHLGPAAIGMTTGMNINFLRRAGPGLLLGEGRVLKLGKRLAVVEIAIREETNADMVAHAVATCSIP